MRDSLKKPAIRLKDILLRENYMQLCKFVIVGITNTMVDYLTFFVLNEVFRIYYQISQVIAYSAGVLNSFFLNRAWTFSNNGREKGAGREGADSGEPVRRAGKQFIDFLLVNILSLLLTMAGLKLLVDIFHFNLYISKLLVTAVSLMVNFLGSKLWVFRSNGNDKN